MSRTGFHSESMTIGGWPTFAGFGKGGDSCSLRRGFHLRLTEDSQCALFPESTPTAALRRDNAGDGWTQSQLYSCLAKKSCDRRPRHSHLYKKRKGGPSTRGERSAPDCGSYYIAKLGLVKGRGQGAHPSSAASALAVSAYCGWPVARWALRPSTINKYRDPSLGVEGFIGIRARGFASEQFSVGGSRFSDCGDVGAFAKGGLSSRLMR
jgi:hypothetical protein